jgi:YrbI family 3-deoxy-D-manno-octulosonate 8-phosphate phosphatase
MNIAIIPARGGSKGLPRKNVLPLCGKPLISWAIEAALNAASIDRVFVSTDDAEIAAISEQAGASVIWRPAELASDTASSESALIHGLLEVGKLKMGDGVHRINEDGRRKMEDRRAEGSGVDPNSNIHNPISKISRPWQKDDILVFLQCTSPLTSGADIDAVVEKLISEKADSAFSVTDFHYFLWKDGHAGAEAINHDKSFRPRRQDREPQFVENGAIYAMRIPGFLEAEHRFFGKTVFHAMPRERCWEIDEPVDFEIAEILLRKRLQTERTKLLPGNISAVVFDFDGVLTDDRVLTSQDQSEAVFCTRKDGMGLRLLQEGGLPVLILSSEENPVVRARGAKLKVDVIHGSLDKAPLLQEWAAKQNIDLGATVYVGNDINDIGPMSVVGCPVAVADAHPEAKRRARIILNQCGGAGAARELSDMILARLAGADSST